MRHIDEFTLMMYMDNEIDTEERKQIELHLSFCAHCQDVYSQLLAEQALLVESFAVTTEPTSRIELNAFAQVQIEAIASLHRKHHSRSRSYSGWLFAGAAAVMTYLLFILPYMSDWFNSAYSTWQFEVLWTSAFWLKENIGDFLAAPQTIALEISLFFLMLVGTLIFLNYRRSSLQRWDRSEGGIKR